MGLLSSRGSPLGPLSGRVAGLRVGYLGGLGARLLGAGPSALTIRPQMVGAMREHLGWLDVLVLDDVCEGFDRQSMEQAVRAARAMGSRVLGLSSGERPPLWSGLVDAGVRVSAPNGSGLAPAVDPRCVNPIGYQSGVEGEVEVVSAPTLGRGKPGEDLAATIEGLRASRAAELRFPAAADGLEGARWVIHLAAAGVPVISEIGPELERLIGPDLAANIRSSTRERCGDLNERDLISIRQRRVALQQHSASRRWEWLAERIGLRVAPPPAVSIVLCTKRPEQVGHALEQVERQTYAPCELILVLHGDGFPTGIGRQVEQVLTIPHRVVRVPGTTSVGLALNAGAGLASGDLLTKMDDDDWYGRDHLWDLVLALDYSGAHLVGKGVEFVYLADLGVTARGRVARSETFSAGIAGGTLTLRRKDFEAVGGFRDAVRAEDRGLIRDIEADGGRVYRTHGHGYVYHRHGRGQTWNVGSDADHFLRKSVLQVRGLAREAADL